MLKQGLGCNDLVRFSAAPGVILGEPRQARPGTFYTMRERSDELKKAAAEFRRD
jgi:hypothetical protein